MGFFSLDVLFVLLSVSDLAGELDMESGRYEFLSVLVHNGIGHFQSFVSVSKRVLVQCLWQENELIGPLHDLVTWYKIKNTGEQVAQWDFQNKGRCIVLEVPLRNLLTSIFNFVPCDRVVQRAYLVLSIM